MSRAMESLSTVNSFIRTILALVVIGGVSAGGYFGYTTYNSKELAVQKKDQQLQEKDKLLTEFQDRLKEKESDLDKLGEQLSHTREELTSANKDLKTTRDDLQQSEAQVAKLTVDVKEAHQQIDKLAAAMRLLKVNHRLARLTVVDQDRDPDSNELFSVLEFVEVNDRGLPLDEKPKRFRIKGDVVYIDNWVVKFDDKYVEQADIDRATSLVLFRRIFGEYQEPSEGIRLDEVGARPKAYGVGEPTDFEKRIWKDFWNIANDDAKARELGIRAAHGEAPSIKVQKGKSYKVQLRASDGLSILPDDMPPAPRPVG